MADERLEARRPRSKILDGPGARAVVQDAAGERSSGGSTLCKQVPRELIVSPKAKKEEQRIASSQVFA
jgi:membrane peptidoglycan carboxypeptidase